MVDWLMVVAKYGYENIQIWLLGYDDSTILIPVAGDRWLHCIPTYKAKACSDSWFYFYN